MSPTKEQAEQFALMLHAGLPASDAILYFTDSSDPAEVAALLSSWTRSKAVKEASGRLTKKPWQDMNLDEKIKHALDLHYAGLAYFLLSHNYSEVGPNDKAKSDTARQALEAKLAGLAGKTDAFTRFFDDLKQGKLTDRMQPQVAAVPVKMS